MDMKNLDVTQLMTKDMADLEEISLEELEGLRAAIKRKLLFITLPCALVILIGVVLNKLPIEIIGVVLVIASILFVAKQYFMFTAQYKNIFVRSSLNEVFDNLNYLPFQGLPREVIADTKMMRMGDSFYSNDYIEGDYKGVHVKQSDVRITETHHDSDGDSHTVTLFSGRWMVFDFNKEFKANVQVVQKGFNNAKRKTIFGKKEELYKKVEMEDVAFNQEFKVYAQNEHDAFYILTPAMMDRIRRVSSSVNGNLILCFVDDNLHVGVNTRKDSFEASPFKKIDPETAKESVLHDIRVITDFVDELSLDTKLFKA